MMRVIDPDEQFFIQHPDRQAHIRMPKKEPSINRQRGVTMADECQGEFWSLGAHDAKRRRIILWRVPAGNPVYEPGKIKVLKIPFLAFADETIEDRDDVLLPFVQEIMINAAQGLVR